MPGAPPLDPRRPGDRRLTGPRWTSPPWPALTDPEMPPPETGPGRARCSATGCAAPARSRSHCRRRATRGSPAPAGSPLSRWKPPCRCQRSPTPRAPQNGTLSRLFQQETGMSYPQWRAQARAIHAMIPLAQGESVTDTASLCGWSTTSAFIDSFRRAMGQTPGAYRDLAAERRNRKIPAAKQNPPAAHLIDRTGCRPAAPAMAQPHRSPCSMASRMTTSAAAPTTPDERAGHRVCPSRWAPFAPGWRGHRKQGSRIASAPVTRSRLHRRTRHRKAVPCALSERVHDCMVPGVTVSALAGRCNRG